MHIKHLMLSIALCGPIVGTTTKIHAAEAEKAKAPDMPEKAQNPTSETQQHASYVTHFFKADIENFDAGYTVDGLHQAVSKICAEYDSTQAAIWNNINIIQQPQEAAAFILNNHKLFSQAGAALPETEHAAYITIKETIGWEFLDQLLFGNDNSIINTYNKPGGWNELVTYIRTVFAETPYADIANSLPLSQEFPFLNKVSNTTKCQHIKGIIQKYASRFPKTLQNRKEESGAENNVRKRLISVIAQ